MRTFNFQSLENAYPMLAKVLLEEGSEVAPRGYLTKEITPVCITITNPRMRVIPSGIRKLNYGFMCAELLWILSGSNSLEHIAHYNSAWRNFSDDGKVLHGAYGERIFRWNGGIVDQFKEAYQLLLEDNMSRQATIVLFDPSRDYQPTKDKPCTNLIRFIIRNNKLIMTVYMRSNDISKGFPYDTFNFTMLQEIMAGLLGVEVGDYNHIVDSFHIYEQDYSMFYEVTKESLPTLYPNGNIDARLSEEAFKEVISKVFIIEKDTRTKYSCDLKEIEEKITSIDNKYWASMASLIAVYNIRKAKRNKNDVDYLKKYVTNEFKEIVEKWKPIN